MPRKPRFFLPDVPAHIVQRGHSQAPVFFEPDDYSAYLTWLHEAANRYDVAIHAYVLMTNHVHLLATPVTKDGVGLMMQYTGRHYVPYINAAYGSSGSIWEGRYKASLIQDESYLLTCMCYIELNPVRSGMVHSPGAYKWSSYKANALGHNHPLITEHELYARLGATRLKRRCAYKALFKGQIEEKDLKDIRASWQTGTPLGNDRFKAQIEAKLKCKVGQARRGRPSASIKASKGSDPL